MSLTVAIHQPQYIPWLPYFDKMDHADIFIYLDDVEYSASGVQNRNQIKIAEGKRWLTVPVLHTPTRIIADRQICQTYDWRTKHTRMIEGNYRKAAHFGLFDCGLKNIFEHDWKLLADLNIATTEWLKTLLGIKCKTMRASEIQHEGHKQDMVISICKALGATDYYSGNGARVFQDADTFYRNGIKLHYQDFTGVEYRQCWPKQGANGFIPDLSALDLVLNEGPHAREIMLMGQEVRVAYG